jgi:hypothetical protein
MRMAARAAICIEMLVSPMSEINVECKHGLKMGRCRVCNEPVSVAKRRTRTVKGNSLLGRKTEENSESYFNHPWPEWNEMRDLGLSYLREIAAKEKTVTYEGFWNAVRLGVGRDIGKPFRQIPLLLRHVGEKSFDDSGLVVTALVVTEATEPSPSEGFFRLASRLELIPEDESPETGVKWLGMTAAQRTFWLRHKESLYEHFSRG